jgi:hypothetical protein
MSLGFCNLKLPEKLPWLLLLLLTLMGTAAHADVALLLEEPAGDLAHVVGTGHVSLYLSRVCVDQPNHLRRCGPGENGVVIGRYHNADGYDWTAIPLLPYLYAVDEPRKIPESVDKADVARLRNNYRRAHLKSLVSDSAYREDPDGHWTQLVGAAYQRRIYVFEIKTTPEQDDRLIEKLNSDSNRPDFNFLFHNCANFAEFILNLYYPHAIHRSFSRDLGIATPKQIAKSLESYAHRHKDLDLSIFEIPQVPGKIHRSGNVYGVLGTLLRKKQYVIPLVIWQPYVVAGMAVTYVLEGRFNPGHDAVKLNHSDTERALLHNATPPFPKAGAGSIQIVSTAHGSGRRATGEVGGTTGEHPLASPPPKGDPASIAIGNP